MFDSAPPPPTLVHMLLAASRSAYWAEQCPAPRSVCSYLVRYVQAIKPWQRTDNRAEECPTNAHVQDKK